MMLFKINSIICTVTKLAAMNTNPKSRHDIMMFVVKCEDCHQCIESYVFLYESYTIDNRRTLTKLMFFSDWSIVRTKSRKFHRQSIMWILWKLCCEFSELCAAKLVVGHLIEYVKANARYKILYDILECVRNHLLYEYY